MPPSVSPPLLQRSIVLTLLLMLTPACAEEPTAGIQLVLTPDPALGSIEEVLSQVETIQVVVDAEGGLKGVEGPGLLEGGGTAEDWDDDGVLEVRFETTALNTERLPILEIGLTDNSGKELSFIILGFPPGGDLEREQAAAAGAVSASCPAGESHKVGIPFNLKASHRPPRVVLVLPPDGTSEPLFDLGSVAVVLSTTVDEKSAAEHFKVITSGGDIVATTLKEETLIASAGGDAHERRSLLTLTIEDMLKPGRYTVEVDPGMMSTAGRRFDQDHSTPEEEGFVSHFTMENEGIIGGGEPCESCPVGFGCEEGRRGCVPLMGCGGGCQTGFICHQGQDLCVEDCRVLGVCADPTIPCDPGSGLCQ